MSFPIERAEPSEVEALCAIEREAVQLFRGHPAWPSYSAVSIPPELLRQAIDRGLVWVARDEAGEPVGFVWLDTELADGAIGIAEIDVLPAYGRRGIGAALLEHACAWAREAGYRRVGLGTLAEVPWNAPFYAKHGFAVVDKNDPAFAFARDRDRENGFPDELRVFMSRPLAPLVPGAWTVWPAPAKLNLFLRITGRRADGYHELQTVFRLLDWGDEVRLRVRDDGAIRRTREVAGVPESADLVVRAARLLQEHAGTALGADIAVDKRIPMGGGLGGGSSDAATVLVALNQLWQLGLDEEALAELGRRLGADVPVFVRGRSAWAEGVGERLTPLALPARHYVVLDPHEPVPTAALFQAPELTRNAPRATISSFVSGETTENAFAPVVRARHPRVAAALDWLGGFGQARLSGSGGCVFLELRSLERAQAVARQCPAAFTAHLATGVDVSPLHEAAARHRGAA
ncbi:MULTISPECIES: 4-(cytidine 5'-diphospho)-2-C-methyl-D-erythritol kinase [Rhodanobacter]|uniref:4-(cytidine 5'-diphospho)-2-C-methyl-D-erythritol kinase n=1 Tax=Rhodanobacter TaxID=75309 RepID=UPI000260F3C5|nr:MULTISPECIES: 4-(cytidine 5'-diphospho)-2-C-methyl-D-erythritol kinase [Rhodanobacter]EIM00024.1 4-diphosphocytidyl-2-C-methyl-D-erythritol kinase [Rhodanobacter thiooxydans LCS2]KZC19826.1 4-diphosphocytidyl-2C-methyl-D-erythritol kinase [Rhodanobacter denitrificans]UJJ59202.1 4-(cytidine 5'-diphospho)-2-C-methyl-D-erythritol kinase [Rhodanobacter denitrificans]UJM94759.1 4-(cytidine 5'-diphospho)-2-C-methyl-D-erythritol kinase [Rhodanobacter denitrificans]UJM98289.1 4-(cytidine 5'-diphosp